MGIGGLGGTVELSLVGGLILRVDGSAPELDISYASYVVVSSVGHGLVAAIEEGNLVGSIDGLAIGVLLGV